MRKILFRAWDKVSKKYREFDGMHDTMTINEDGKVEYYNLQNGSGGDEYILEQFTGLVDRNGKRIFEGDIYVTDYNQHTLKNNVQVLSVGGAFCGGKTCLRCSPLAWISEEDNEELYLDEEFLNHVVVIGNIHDNPELLESKS